MNDRDCLGATVDELQKYGFKPEYARNGKHWRVKADGLPPIFCASSASDGEAAKAARRTVRKIILRSR